MGSNINHKKMMALDKTRFLVDAVIGQVTTLTDFHFNTNLSRPYMVLIEPTLRCPMRCKFCDLPFDNTFPKHEEMSLAQWKRILKELYDYSPLIREVFISGGEPFLRHDMSDILEYAHQIGLGTRMITIGAFCTPKVCDRLIASPMSWLKFSIHSADPQIHNELVGRNVHAKAIGAIKYLRNRNYKGNIGILTTVWKKNVDALADILNLACDIGVDSVFFRPLFGNTRARRLFGESVPKHEDCVIDEAEKIKNAIEELKRLKKQGLPVANTEQQLNLLYLQSIGANRGVPGCHMMYESIYIRPNGDVEICGHMSLGTMGNIAGRSVADVLNSKEAYTARHAVSRRCRCEGNAFVRKTHKEKVEIALSLIRN